VATEIKKGILALTSGTVLLEIGKQNTYFLNVSGISPNIYNCQT
jgi:hypothetical protein